MKIAKEMGCRTVGAGLDVRGVQRLDIAPLLAIFENIDAEEYERLIPLAAKTFVLEESRRRIFMNPEKYKNASAEAWEEYFAGVIKGAYVKDAHMDFGILCPLADRADVGKWQESKLEAVKEYLLSLL